MRIGLLEYAKFIVLAFIKCTLFVYFSFNGYHFLDSKCSTLPNLLRNRFCHTVVSIILQNPFGSLKIPRKLLLINFSNLQTLIDSSVGGPNTINELNISEVFQLTRKTDGFQIFFNIF